MGGQRICNWKANRKVEVPALDLGGAFKFIVNCTKSSRCVQEVANAEGKRYPARTLYRDGIIWGIRRHLVESVGSEAFNPQQPKDKSFAIFRRCLNVNIVVKSGK
ncbi:hypothetical protein P5673_000456 [Acropora cervicornis]|uniref:Uncharacterized protein n=1 Tax=Acropora cervicornis TaxID=6130 RepID=A0AAD9VHS7_ACRCE|nr:hypothetical protein P5673_000456 [Acropora cervicornis]